MKKVHIFISGNVQGVGFRSFVKQHARSMGVNGWVKNTGNMVEALFQGEDSTVQKLIDLCNKGPELAMVKEVKIEEKKEDKCFDAFCVRF